MKLKTSNGMNQNPNDHSSLFFNQQIEQETVLFVGLL
jgi:hypothetical protein